MKIVYKGVVLLFIFFLISCKKNKKDTQPPTISITYPISGQAYKMFDTVRVYAHVSDNERLASVSITLTDANHVAQQGSINASIISDDIIVDMKYILTQFHLQSGTYYIQITADDGYNTTVAYQQIYITESPTQLWGYCAVLKSNNKLIKYYDTLNHTIGTPISLNTGYNGMRYGGYNEQLYVNGNGAQQMFQSYYMQPQTDQVSYIETASTQQQNYTCLYTDGNKPYIGFYNGSIYSYQNTGSQSTSYTYSFSPPPYVYPYYFTTTSLYGVAAFRNTFGSPNDQLVMFHLSSGGLSFNNITLAGNSNLNSIVAVFEKSQDSLYVLGNDITNNAVVYIYSVMGNSFSAIATGSGKMLSAVKVNNEYIIFSTTTGVYPCNGLTVSPISLLPNAAQKLCYQPKLNMLMVATSTNVIGYTVGSTTLSVISNRTINFTGDSLIDFEVITNK